MATFTTTALQDAALAARLRVVNRERTASGQRAFATVDEYVASLLTTAEAVYLEARVQLVADAYRAATEKIRGKVDALLGAG